MKRDRGNTIRLKETREGDSIRLSPTGIVWVVQSHDGHITHLIKEDLHRNVDNAKIVFEVDDENQKEV